MQKLTDLQFYEECVKKGLTQNNLNYYNLMNSLAHKIHMLAKPGQTVFEIGAGPGALVECLTNLGRDTMAIEPNIHFVEFYKKRTSNFFVSNIDLLQWLTITDIDNDERLKMYGVAIESFEHMDDETLEMFFLMASDIFDGFLFSSTPQITPNDEIWGHINIKSEEEWIKLWDVAGFKLKMRHKTPTKWTLEFELK